MSRERAPRDGRLMVVLLVALGALAGVAPAVLASASPPLVAVLGLGGVAAVLMSGELDRSARARRGFGPRWYSLARNLAMLLFVAITVAAVAGIAIPAPPLVTTWLLTPLLYLAGAGIAQRFLGMSRVRTIIIGSGEVAHTAIETTRRHPELGIDVVGIVDDPPPVGEFHGFALGHSRSFRSSSRGSTRRASSSASRRVATTSSSPRSAGATSSASRSPSSPVCSTSSARALPSSRSARSAPSRSVASPRGVSRRPSSAALTSPSSPSWRCPPSSRSPSRRSPSSSAVPDPCSSGRSGSGFEDADSAS